MPVTTPTNKLTIKGVPVYVKREDLFETPIPLNAGPVVPTDPHPAQFPPPPFAKMRGLMHHLERLKELGVTIVGYMDTSISMAGWGVSWYANVLGLKAVIYYPDYKDGYRHNMADHISACAQSGAEIVMLEKPTQLSINWYRARNALYHVYGESSVLLPQGLPFWETVESVADEVREVPQAALTGSVVMCVGSGTMAAGVLTGLNRTMNFTTLLYGVMVSQGDTKAMRRKVIKKIPGLRFGMGPRVHIIDAGYNYEQVEDINTPFPCNAYYDKKAWRWLMGNLHGLPQPILFWNIGSDYSSVYNTREVQCT